MSGKLNAVKWFLEKGATVACESNRGWNTLHHAAQGSDPDTIDLILTHLPDIESKTADGETPLIIAVLHGKLQGVLKGEPILRLKITMDRTLYIMHYHLTQISLTCC